MSQVHPSSGRCHVENDEVDWGTDVSRENAMGSRVVMMRDVNTFGCIDVGKSNRGT